MLQVDPVPELPVHVPPVANDGNIFNILAGNKIMKIINADLVPIMIATEGIDFFDKNNAEKAADRIANIIAAKELGGFTNDTLPRALRGRKQEMTAFTTKVLGNIGANNFVQLGFDYMIV